MRRFIPFCIESDGTISFQALSVDGVEYVWKMSGRCQARQG